MVNKTNDDNYVRKIVANNIVKYRKAAGYSQEVFAEIIDVSVRGLSDIERALNMPRPENLVKIVEKLNITLADLFKTPETKKIRLERAYKHITDVLSYHKDNEVLIYSVYSFLNQIIKIKKIIK